jgi:carboxymethylenebutenolidase
MLAALLPVFLCLPTVMAQDSPTPPARAMSWTGVLDEAAFAALHDLKDEKAPPLLGRDVEFAGGRGYLSRPPLGKASATVIVLHEWWGLNDHVKHWTDRLAADGYDALAIDLYGGKIATDRDEALAAMQAVDETAALATLRAAHRYATANDGLAAERTGVIGWCFGGAWSLRLAAAEPELDACVLYYGRLLEDSESLTAMRAPVLGIFGDLDTSIPPAAVTRFAGAMRKAGKSLEVRQYPAHHAFANPSGARYDKKHAAFAWEEARAFLARHLAPPASEGQFSKGTRKLAATMPEGWQRGGDRQMRLATFTHANGCECVVSAFPGDTGGLLANLNRWRGQLGQAPMESAAITALPKLPILGRMATLIRIDGEEGKGSMLGAVAPQAEETVFVKLTGPTAAVEAATPAFLALCRSLR